MLEREKQIIASFLVDLDCKQYICHLNKEDFIEPINQAIFEIIYDLYEKNESIDYVNVTEKLPAQIGYISSLQNEVISTVNILDHIKKQKELSKRKKISKLLENAKASIDKNDAIDATINALFSDLSNQEVSNDVVGIKDALKRFYGDLEGRYNGDIHQGYTIGYKDFDDIITFRNTKFYMIAGRPSHGKTSFALFILRSLVKKGVKCLIFSLEMPFIELLEIILSSETHIESTKIQYPKGNLSNDNLVKIAAKMKEFSNYHLDFVDNVNLNIDELCNIARTKKALGQLDFLIIDYIQLIKIDVKRGMNRNLALGEVSRKLKLIAMELDIPVLALGQLNRDVSKRPDKTPMLSDIRDSGEIEQDLDCCMFVNYPYMDAKEGEGDKHYFEILVRKNRRGKNNENIKTFKFFGEYQNFIEIKNENNSESKPQPYFD